MGVGGIHEYHTVIASGCWRETRVFHGNHEWVFEGDTSITRLSRVGVGGRNEYFTLITSGCLRVTRVSHGNHEWVLEETRV